MASPILAQTIITAVTTMVAASLGGWISGRYVLKGQDKASAVLYEKACKIILIELIENLQKLVVQVSVLPKNTDLSIPVFINLDLSTDLYFRYELDLVGGPDISIFKSVRDAVVEIRHAELLGGIMKSNPTHDLRKHKPALVRVFEAHIFACNALSTKLPAKVAKDLMGKILIEAKNSLTLLRSDSHMLSIEIPIAGPADLPISPGDTLNG